MNGFTKLSADIITSSIWLEDDATLRIWIGMLAMADQFGVVPGSVPGLAHLCRVSLDQMQTALEKFQGPDAHSRTKDNEGRRIEAVDGGWLLLNHSKHREKRDPEIRKQQIREAVARHRAKQNSNQNVSQCNQDVIKVSQSKPKQKAEAEADTERVDLPSPLSALWNSICLSLPKVKEVSAARKKKEKERLSQRPLAEWKTVFSKIEASTFCKGGSQRGWKASYDWIIKNEDNAIKVLEGAYDDRGKPKSGEKQVAT